MDVSHHFVCAVSIALVSETVFPILAQLQIDYLTVHKKFALF